VQSYVQLISYFKKFAEQFNSVAFKETSYLNTDMGKSESSQNYKSRVRSGLILRKLAANLELFDYFCLGI